MTATTLENAWGRKVTTPFSTSVESPPINYYPPQPPQTTQTTQPPPLQPQPFQPPLQPPLQPPQPPLQPPQQQTAYLSSPPPFYQANAPTENRPTLIEVLQNLFAQSDNYILSKITDMHRSFAQQTKQYILSSNGNPNGNPNGNSNGNSNSYSNSYSNTNGYSSGYSSGEQPPASTDTNWSKYNFFSIMAFGVVLVALVVTSLVLHNKKLTSVLNTLRSSSNINKLANPIMFDS